jgi:hypothetical protein
MKLAQLSPQDGQERFLFQNSSSSFDVAAWINVSIPAPPYYPDAQRELNITGYWGFNGATGLPSELTFGCHVARRL